MRLRCRVLVAICAFGGIVALPSEKHAHERKQDAAKIPHSHAKESPEEDSHSGEHADGEHEADEPSSGVGEGKAVEAASRERGIRLSEKAARTIGIATESVKRVGAGDYALSPQCVVYFQDKKGVYRLRDGWFKLVEVEVVRQLAKGIVIRSDGIKPGDNVVSAGVPLLRVSELEAFGGSGEGHGH